MSDYRRQVYDLYVSTHLRHDANTSSEAYDRTARFLHRRYARWLPPDKSAAILDLGCGHGKTLYWLHQEGYRNLNGIDISPEQVELARRVHPEVQHGDLFALLESRRHSFDVVIALDVIEHFRKEEAMRLTRLVLDALRPRGRFLLQTVNGSSPFAGHHRYHDLTHETAYTTHSLESLLRLSGFTQVEFAPMGPIVHGPVSALRWVLWRLIALGLAGYHLVENGTTGDRIFTQCFAACAFK